jgi:hypothetical protein
MKAARSSLESKKVEIHISLISGGFYEGTFGDSHCDRGEHSRFSAGIQPAMK